MRRKHYVIVDGEKLGLSAAVRKHGVEGLTPSNLQKRIEHGLSTMEALNRPVKGKSYVYVRDRCHSLEEEEHPQPTCPKVKSDFQEFDPSIMSFDIKEQVERELVRERKNAEAAADKAENGSLGFSFTDSVEYQRFCIHMEQWVQKEYKFSRLLRIHERFEDIEASINLSIQDILVRSAKKSLGIEQPGFFSRMLNKVWPTYDK